MLNLSASHSPGHCLLCWSSLAFPCVGHGACDRDRSAANQAVFVLLSSTKVKLTSHHQSSYRREGHGGGVLQRLRTRPASICFFEDAHCQSSACRCSCACRVVCPLFWICFFRAYHPWSRVRALGWSLPGSAARVSEPCRLPCLRPRVSRVMYVSLLVQITVGCRPGCGNWPPGWLALSGLCLAQAPHPVPTYSNLVYARIDVPTATSAAMQQLPYHGPSLHAGLLHIHARLSRGAWCGETHTYGKQYASDHSLTHPLTHPPTLGGREKQSGSLWRMERALKWKKELITHTRFSDLSRPATRPAAVGRVRLCRGGEKTCSQGLLLRVIRVFRLFSPRAQFSDAACSGGGPCSLSSYCSFRHCVSVA